jgi:predicted nucleotidyltransferase
MCGSQRGERFFLFGSATRERTVEDVGDLNFVAPFKPMPPVVSIRNCFCVAEQLQALPKAPVDLVELDSTKNPYFKTSKKR